MCFKTPQKPSVSFSRTEKRLPFQVKVPKNSGRKGKEAGRPDTGGPLYLFIHIILMETSMIFRTFYFFSGCLSAEANSFKDRKSADLRKLREFAEVGIAFLFEGVPPFLRFIRRIIKQRRVAAQLLQAGKPVRIGIERGFEETECRCTL